LGRDWGRFAEGVLGRGGVWWGGRIGGAGGPGGGGEGAPWWAQLGGGGVGYLVWLGRQCPAAGMVVGNGAGGALIRAFTGFGGLGPANFGC